MCLARDQHPKLQRKPTATKLNQRKLPFFNSLFCHFLLAC